MERFRFESLRALSFEQNVTVNGELFKNWTPWRTEGNIFTANSLAENGFIYFGVSDVVRCAFCQKRFDIRLWNASTIISLEHVLASPQCSFVVGRFRTNITKHEEKADCTFPPDQQIFHGAYPLVHRASFTDKTPKELTKLGIYLRCGYYNVSMLQLNDRVETFEVAGWSHNESSVNLARAGFYYVGPSDYVECFQCGLGMKNWNPSFCPFEHHMYFSPNCSHTILIKGLTFAHQLKKKIAEKFLHILNTEGVGSGHYVLSVGTEQSIKAAVASIKSDDSRCLICLSKTNNIILFPCRHVSTCADCTSNLSKCAVCNTPFTAFTQIYYEYTV